MTIQDALDYCLENREELGAQEAASRFPQYREELRPLLSLAASMGSLTVPAVPVDRREAMKARLMAAAAAGAPRVVEAAPVLSAAPAAPAAPARTDGSVRPVSPSRRALPWFLRPGWVVAAAAVLLLALSWWSSANSLPDSPFYGIKLASENIMLNLAGSDADKVRAHVRLADSRLYDLRAMEKKGELAQARAAFDNYEAHLESSVTLWEGLSGQTHTDLAKLLYVSSAAGEVTFHGGIDAQAASLPAPLQQKISNTEAVLDSVSSEAAGTLAAAKIDPNSTLGTADNETAPLLTPVAPGPVPAASSTATAPQPAGQPSASVVAIAPTSTLPAAGQPSTATPRAGVPPQPGETITAVATIPAAPVETPTSMPAPVSTSTSTLPPAVTSTSIPVPTSTQPVSPPGQQGTATSTPTVHLPGPPALSATPVSTPTPIQPEPTEIPTISVPTDTPLPAPPTDTPVPTVEASPTAVPTSMPPTPIPPSATPIPPSATPAPPSPTPTPSALCNLHIGTVTASCADANDVNWSADVSNPGSTTVHASWTAELLVQSGGGGFKSVNSVNGTSDFPPGTTTVSGTISYVFPANARMRVRFSVDTTGYGCTLGSHMSQPVDACH